MRTLRMKSVHMCGPSTERGSEQTPHRHIPRCRLRRKCRDPRDDCSRHPGGRISDIESQTAERPALADPPARRRRTNEPLRRTSGPFRSYGCPAIVLVTVARWLRLQQMITPRVGVREGLLYNLAAAQMLPPAPTPEQRKHSQVILAGAESFACRVHCDLKHAQQVRSLALQLFDKLWPYHRLDLESRTILEAAATLHDSGVLINRKGHHRHGEPGRLSRPVLAKSWRMSAGRRYRKTWMFNRR